MTDFSLKKHLNHGELVGEATLVEVSNEPREILRFRTRHSLRPGTVDLYEFATGVPNGDLAKSRQEFAFSGRPELIRELAPAIFKRYRDSPATTIKQLLSCLRWWWRFLDAFEMANPLGGRFTSSLQWDSIHYAFYRFGHIKGVRFCHDGTASSFFTLLGDVRRAQGIPFWWKAIGTPDKQREIISDNDLRKLYQHFTARVRTAMRRMESAAIKSSESQAAQLSISVGEVNAVEVATDPDPGDVAPTSDEVRCFIVLFILYSGWNPQVVLDIDIGTRDADGNYACMRPSYQNPETHTVVTSLKLRAGETIQQTESMNKHALSPANLLIFLERHTVHLRTELGVALEALNAEKVALDKDSILHDDIDIRIARLRQQLHSPWLYRSRAYNYQGIGCISGTDHLSFRVNTRDLQPIAWALELINSDLAIRRQRILQRNEIPPSHLDPIAAGLALTDLRDAFIIWRYENSGHSWIEALLASGSSGLSALKSYLNKKRLKVRVEKEHIKVMNTVWHTIKMPTGRVPHSFTTVVAARINGVTEDQISAWLSQKERTYAGTGCRDISNPPKNIAPKHQTGSRCLAQRCLLCPTHAILITDERGADVLAKIRAGLNHIKSKLSLVAWNQSDWPTELDNIESAWEEFDQTYINRRLTWWEKEIADGRHIPL